MRGLLNILILSGAVCYFLNAASAQSPETATVELTLLTREFDALDGLSSNCIYNIETDGQGFLWFATSKGLDRFDGSRFVNHLYSDLVQPEQNLAQVIINLKAQSDTLFRVTLSQALRFPDTDTTFDFLPLSPERKAPAIPQNIPRDFFNSLGNWQFTSDREHKALFVNGVQSTPEFEENKPFTTWEGGPQDSLLVYRSMYSESILLYRTADGIGLSESDLFVEEHNIQGQSHPHILSFDGECIEFFCRKQSIYPKGTLVRQSMAGDHEASGHWNDWFPFPIISDLHRIVLRINPWNDDIWCFLDNQLAIVNRDRELKWSGTISEHLQFASLINCIRFNSEHQAWVGSCKGLMLIQTEPDNFEAFFTADVTLNDDIGGLMDGLNSCRAIQELGPDSFAFATNGHGVRLFVGGKSHMLLDEYGGGAGLHFRSDTLFFANQNGVAFLKKDGTIGWIYQGPVPNTQWSLHPGKQGEWLLGATGIWEVNQTEREVIPHAMPLGSETAFIYQFTTIRDTLWAVGASGIMAMTPGERDWQLWHEVSTNAPVIQEAHHILEDSRGIQWISTATRGLLSWDPVKDSLTQFGPAFGLPSSTVYGGIEDSKGHLWFSTDNGLFRMTGDTREVEIFDERHGLHETEFNRTGVHLGPSGMAFFSTIDGLVRFNPSDFGEEQALTAPLVLTSLLHHSARSNSIEDGLTEFLREGQITMSSEEDFLSVRFSLLEFTNAPKYFRYRIQNVRTDKPDDWFPLDRSEINLSGLPSGLNILEIQGRLRGTPWPKSILRVPLDVPFPWYQDSAKIALLLILLTITSFTIIRFIINNLRLRNTILSDMVEGRTRDLKDALELKEIYLKEVHHRVKNNLQIIGSLIDLQAAGVEEASTRRALLAGRSRIESISLIHKHLYMDRDMRSVVLIDFIQEYAEMMSEAMFDDPSEITWRLEGDNIRLGIEEAQPLGLLINELLTNSLQHGRSTGSVLHITIEWRVVHPHTLRLDFHDNGPGLASMNPEGNSGSLGIKLIHSLTRQLKGTIVLAEGSGTRWIAHLNCRFENMNPKKENKD